MRLPEWQASGCFRPPFIVFRYASHRIWRARHLQMIYRMTRKGRIRGGTAAEGEPGQAQGKVLLSGGRAPGSRTFPEGAGNGENPRCAG